MDDKNWIRIRVSADREALDTVSAILSMVDNALMIEDFSDVEQELDGVYGDLIDEELLKKDRTHAAVSVFVPEEQSPREAELFIRDRLREEKIEAEITVSGVREEDWADSWKKYYHPIHTGRRLVIVPVWEEYEPKDGELTVLMDPGMAFGTGTHETTRLVMAQIEKYLKPGDAVLDVGTGSGILSICASLLGAKSVNAYDIDPTAVRIARENAEINGRHNITVGESDLLSGVERKKYDLICANIVADIIIKMSPDLYSFAHEGTTFIASGILNERRDEVLAAMEKTPFRFVDGIDENGWCALIFICG